MQAWDRNPVEISTIAPEEYIDAVLPETLTLWGGRRDLAKYAGDFREDYASASGRRRRFTVGVRDGNGIACSCKLYDREFRWGEKRMRTTGIGAVFTPAALRGRGYASAMLGALLDRERAAGLDFAYLFSDIHPLFYERLGFFKLPSRILSMRAASLDGTPAGAMPLEAGDWSAVRGCFDALEAHRPWGFRRAPLAWNWLKHRSTAPGLASTQPVSLAIKRDRTLLAYVIGRRVLRRDAFVFEDFAFGCEEGRARIPALLRAAAGDLSRVVGWLPPPIAREALPRGSVRARKDAITMVAPLSSLARAWYASFAATLEAGRTDPVWEADHV